MSALYAALNAVSDQLGEWNDCAVKAVAVAAGVPYAEAHALLKAAGRRDRRGMKNTLYKDVLRALGLALEPVKVPPCTRRTLVDRLRPTGTYLVRVRGHVFCVKDGVQVDRPQWARTCKRVREVLAIVPPGGALEPAVAGGPARKARSGARGKDLGIGVFMRERLRAGDAPKAVVARVRERFPASTATVKDVYMVRRRARDEEKGRS